ncbi:MAG TPA: arginine--tRNA ligase, partial [Burkholderiales bacterium]|nr:arginine--tRNA ligase [Burkholderiales bacterium]
MADPKEIFKRILEEGARQVAPGASVEIQLERPKNPQHGDLSSNAAMQLAKQLKRNPRELAQEFLQAIAEPVGRSGIAEALTIAGAGFLNLKLKPLAKLQAVRQALDEGARFGHASAPNPERVQVEFVSANPTGPLHVGHGRNAV